MNYRLSVDFEAVQFFRGLSAAKQTQMIYRLERLRNAPFTRGHVTTTDPVGRDVQVVKVDGFRIFFWSDHAVKTVQVTKIEFDA